MLKFKGFGVKSWRMAVLRKTDEKYPTKVAEVEQGNVNGETKFCSIRESRRRDFYKRIGRRMKYKEIKENNCFTTGVRNDNFLNGLLRKSLPEDGGGGRGRGRLMI